MEAANLAMAAARLQVRKWVRAVTTSGAGLFEAERMPQKARLGRPGLFADIADKRCLRRQPADLELRLLERLART